MAIALTPHMELWIWDTGQLEGFALFFDGARVAHSLEAGKAFKVSRPGVYEIVFSGIDGGATKLVDFDANGAPIVLAFQDAGVQHEYTVIKATGGNQ